MAKKFYCNVRSWGNDLLYIGYDEKGHRVQERIPFEPTLYTTAQPNEHADSMCYDDTRLKAVHHNSIKESKEFIKLFNGVEGFDIYGMDKYPYQYINQEFTRDIEYNTDTIRTHIFDIEVRSDKGFPDPYDALHEITAIALKDVKENKLHIWTQNNPIHAGKFDPDNLQYIDKEDITFELVHHGAPDEKTMLRDFINWYALNPPDVLSGWYSRLFDVPYIYNRLKNVLGTKSANRLSPWGIVRASEQKIKKFGTYVVETVYDIYGVAELDYLELYKKYTFAKSPSYALDAITKKHLGKGKLEFDGTLHDLLTTDYQRYVEYNLVDTERIAQLDDVLKFLDLIIDVSYSGKVAQYNDSLGTVKYWEMLAYSHLCEKGQQPPIKQRQHDVKKDQYAGAYVKEPIAGKHKWIVSYDLASLYPSIIRQVNIGPETKLNRSHPILEDLEHQSLIDKSVDLKPLFADLGDVSLAGNGQLYSKDKQSFFAELMEKFFNKRVVFKKKMAKAEREIHLIEVELQRRGIKY